MTLRSMLFGLGLIALPMGANAVPVEVEKFFTVGPNDSANTLAAEFPEADNPPVVFGFKAITDLAVQFSLSGSFNEFSDLDHIGVAVSDMLSPPLTPLSSFISQSDSDAASSFAIDDFMVLDLAAGEEGYFVFAKTGPIDKGASLAFSFFTEARAVSPELPGVAPIPLPAAAWMLLSAIGGLTLMRRKSAA